MVLRQKLKMAALGALVGALLAAGLFSAGIAFGASYPLSHPAAAERVPIFNIPENPLQQGTETSAEPPQDEETLFEPFWQAWNIVHEQFVDQPVNDSELMRGAIRGMLDSLDDPHSSYMDPDEFTQANIPLDGSYEGIGAWVDPNAEYLTIIAPMEGSPAEEAGLQPGDEVIAVDGEDMTGIDGNVVIRKVMGPSGTEVRLTIRREGEPELLEVSIVRAEIVVPSVQSEMLPEGIAYIQLFSFGTETVSDLRSALEDLLAQDPPGLILDLRGNGGGFLSTAVDVTSEFIPEGVILTERFGDGSEQVHRAKSGGLATEIPLVVLINGGTASASEILAGAVQDYDRGILVGGASFGKGSVQSWIPLKGENGAVRVTIARWYTPNDRLIQEQGLEPDVEVVLDEEDLEEGQDPQLEKAIELLSDG
jgi:carboxyl-terminal processing protease